MSLGPPKMPEPSSGVHEKSLKSGAQFRNFGAKLTLIRSASTPSAPLLAASNKLLFQTKKHCLCVFSQENWTLEQCFLFMFRPTYQPYSSRKYPPLVVDLQETRGGILATHHPTPFGARLYPIFGRACGAIFFVFLHFRAFQAHFQHFLLLPGTEMCF